MSDRKQKLADLNRQIQQVENEGKRLRDELAAAEKNLAESEYGKALARRDEAKEAVDTYAKYVERQRLEELRRDRLATIPPDLAAAIAAVSRELSDTELTFNRACAGVLKTRFAPRHYEPRLSELRSAQQALGQLIVREDYEDELNEIMERAHLVMGVPA